MYLIWKTHRRIGFGLDGIRDRPANSGLDERLRAHPHPFVFASFPLPSLPSLKLASPHPLRVSKGSERARPSSPRTGATTVLLWKTLAYPIIRTQHTPAPPLPIPCHPSSFNSYMQLCHSCPLVIHFFWISSDLLLFPAKFSEHERTSSGVPVVRGPLLTHYSSRKRPD